MKKLAILGLGVLGLIAAASGTVVGKDDAMHLSAGQASEAFAPDLLAQLKAQAASDSTLPRPL